MKINKYIAATFLLLVGLSSCKNEVDDIFDEPATLRMRHMLERCEGYLTAPGSEWRFEYHPSRIAYPTVFVMKFLGNTEVEMFQGVDSLKSSYKFSGQQGPVLSFDSYSLLHPYADPDGTQGESLHGDFEFVIMNAAEDRLDVKGLKYKDKVSFVRVNDGEENKIRLMQLVSPEYKSKYGLSNPFFCTLQPAGADGVDIMASDEDENHVLVSSATDGMPQEHEVVYTREGFSFNPAINVGGNMTGTFEWDPINKVFTDTQGNLRFSSHVAPYTICGNTVDEFSGKAYEFEGCSPSVQTWINGIVASFPDLKTICVYMNYEDSVTTSNDGMSTSLAFLLGDDEKTAKWSYWTIKESEKIREDQVIFKKGNRRGPQMSPIFATDGGKSFCNAFFNSRGQTIIYRGDKIYLVSLNNQSDWISFKPTGL